MSEANSAHNSEPTGLSRDGILELIPNSVDTRAAHKSIAP